MFVLAIDMQYIYIYIYMVLMFDEDKSHLWFNLVASLVPVNVHVPHGHWPAFCFGQNLLIEK